MFFRRPERPIRTGPAPTAERLLGRLLFVHSVCSSSTSACCSAASFWLLRFLGGLFLVLFGLLLSPVVLRLGLVMQV
jgi:hypothetical protein